MGGCIKKGCTLGQMGSRQVFKGEKLVYIQAQSRPQLDVEEDLLHQGFFQGLGLAWRPSIHSEQRLLLEKKLAPKLPGIKLYGPGLFVQDILSLLGSSFRIGCQQK